MYIILFYFNRKLTVAMDQITNNPIEFLSEEQANEFILSRCVFTGIKYQIVDVSDCEFTPLSTLAMTKRTEEIIPSYVILINWGAQYQVYYSPDTGKTMYFDTYANAEKELEIIKEATKTYKNPSYHILRIKELEFTPFKKEPS